jgi:cell division protein ZapA (FtsZ GTPase activity inhibitor)
MKRTVAVKIAGVELSIKSDAEEGYVRSLADLVDARVREVQRGRKGASTHSVALLAALQIADDLVRERERRAELRRQVRARTSRLRQSLAREVGEGKA